MTSFSTTFSLVPFLSPTKEPCPAGAGGRAPAPKVAQRRKARKAQKLARRQQR